MADIFFKDKFTPEDQPYVRVDDRAYRFGDAVFETAIVYNGKVFDWKFHQQRLEDGLKHYRINIDVSALPKIMTELLQKNNVSEGYVRVIISRGESKLVGYKPGNCEPYMVVQTMEKPLPELSDTKLYVSSIRAFYHTPCKTNNALNYTMALIEAEENKCDNALFLSHDDYICETATANIFWVANGVLFTPSTNLPFVPGTIRKRIIELWDGDLVEGSFHIEELKNADEIFMSNVGTIISPVSQILPLGISKAKSAVAMALREKLVNEIKSI